VEPELDSSKRGVPFGRPITSWRELARMYEEGHDWPGSPDWVRAAFLQVTGVLEKEVFPCLFARQANRLRSGWICFVDSVESRAGRETVGEALVDYFQKLKSLPRERTILMPLLVIVKPCYPMLSLKEYREQAWGLFQYLHENDPEPWPSDIPSDPDRDDWTFCFNGSQLFSNVSDPAHSYHSSRNLGDSLVFAMQPRTNFDVVGGDNPKGRRVRHEIRARAEEYEGVPRAPHLGFFGSPGNREWKQMATKDGETDVTYPKVCPFKFKGERDPTRE
jgi:FPC/CPF motif-containing protein YcgG